MSYQDHSEKDHSFYEKLLPRKRLVQNLISAVVSQSDYLYGINDRIQLSNKDPKNHNNRVTFLKNTRNKKIIPDTYHDNCAAIVDEKFKNDSQLESMGFNAVLIDLKTLDYIFINLDRAQRTILQIYYETFNVINQRWQAAQSFIDKIIINPAKKNEPIEALANEVFNVEQLKTGNESSHLVLSANVYINNPDIDIDEGRELLGPMIIITNNWKNPSVYKGSKRFHLCNLGECVSPHRFKDIGSTSVIIFPQKSVYFFLGTYEQNVVKHFLIKGNDKAQYLQSQNEAKNIYNKLLADDTSFCQILSRKRKRIYLHRAQAAADKPSGCIDKTPTMTPAPVTHPTAPILPARPFASVDGTAPTGLPNTTDTAIPKAHGLPDISPRPAEPAGHTQLTTFLPNPTSTAPDLGKSTGTLSPTHTGHDATATTSVTPPRRPTPLIPVRTFSLSPTTATGATLPDPDSSVPPPPDQDPADPDTIDYVTEPDYTGIAELFDPDISNPDGCGRSQGHTHTQHFQRVKNTLTGAKDTVSGAFGSVGAKARGLGTTLAEKAGRAKNSAAKKFEICFGVGASYDTGEDLIDLKDTSNISTTPSFSAPLDGTVMGGLTVSDQAQPTDQLHDTNYLLSKRGLPAFKTTSFINATIQVLTSTTTLGLFTQAKIQYARLPSANKASKTYREKLEYIIKTLNYDSIHATDDEKNQEYEANIESSDNGARTNYYVNRSTMAKWLHSIMHIQNNSGKKKNLTTIESRADNPLSLLISKVKEPEVNRRKERKDSYPDITDENIEHKPNGFRIEPCDIGQLYFALLESLCIWSAKETASYKIEFEVVREINLETLRAEKSPSKGLKLSCTKTGALPDDIFIPDISSDTQKTIEIVANAPTDIAYSEIPSITLPGINQTLDEFASDNKSLQQELDCLFDNFLSEPVNFKLKSEHVKGVDASTIQNLKQHKLIDSKNRVITNARTKVVIKANTNELKFITINLPSPVQPASGINPENPAPPLASSFRYSKRTAETLFGDSETITIKIQDINTKKFKKVEFKLKAVIYLAADLSNDKNFDVANIYHTALIKAPDVADVLYQGWHYYHNTRYEHLEDISFKDADNAVKAFNEIGQCYPEFIVLEKVGVYDFQQEDTASHDASRRGSLTATTATTATEPLLVPTGTPPQQRPTTPPAQAPRPTPIQTPSANEVSAEELIRWFLDRYNVYVNTPNNELIAKITESQHFTFLQNLFDDRFFPDSLQNAKKHKTNDNEIKPYTDRHMEDAFTIVCELATGKINELYVNPTMKRLDTLLRGKNKRLIKVTGCNEDSIYTLFPFGLGTKSQGKVVKDSLIKELEKYAASSLSLNEQNNIYYARQDLRKSSGIIIGSTLHEDAQNEVKAISEEILAPEAFLNIGLLPFIAKEHSTYIATIYEQRGQVMLETQITVKSRRELLSIHSFDHALSERTQGIFLWFDKNNKDIFKVVPIN